VTKIKVLGFHNAARATIVPTVSRLYTTFTDYLLVTTDILLLDNIINNIIGS